MLDVVKHEGLVALDVYPFPLRVSIGTEATAVVIAERCARAYRFLADTLACSPDVALLVLFPGDWPGRARHPTYGMPHQYAGNLIVAGEPNAYWRGVADFLCAAPPAIWEEAQRIYGHTDGDIDLSPFFNLLAVHELAHTFHHQVPFWFPRLWLQEFFANLCLHAYAVTSEPDQWAIFETLPRLLTSMDPAALRHHTLAAFEALYTGVGPLNYTWYQAHLHREVQAVYDAVGPSALRQMWDAFVLPEQELATRLQERIHPRMAQVLLAWPGER